MRNVLIIGGSIIIGFILAAIIVSRRLPRYQYVEYESVEKGKVGVDKTTQIVFDMVTGKRYRSTLFMIEDETGHYASSDSYVHIDSPTTKSLLDGWLKQREVFGDKPFTVEQWAEWKKTNAW